MLRAPISPRKLLGHLSTETCIPREKQWRATFLGHHQNRGPPEQINPVIFLDSLSVISYTHTPLMIVSPSSPRFEPTVNPTCQAETTRNLTGPGSVARPTPVGAIPPGHPRLALVVPVTP